MEKRVAVYNNNTGVIETMSSLLAGEGLKMVAVTGRAQLQELLRAQEIQLLLLDVELDGRGWGEGIEMIHDIRNMTTIPIIIISAQDAETAKIMALNAGADDYVTVGPRGWTGDQRQEPHSDGRGTGSEDDSHRV